MKYMIDKHFHICVTYNLRAIWIEATVRTSETKDQETRPGPMRKIEPFKCLHTTGTDPKCFINTSHYSRYYLRNRWKNKYRVNKIPCVRSHAHHLNLAVTPKPMPWTAVELCWNQDSKALRDLPLMRVCKAEQQSGWRELRRWTAMGHTAAAHYWDIGRFLNLFMPPSPHLWNGKRILSSRDYREDEMCRYK